MNVLDENIPEGQRELLRAWHIPVRQIGQGIGQKGLPDDAIVPLLRELPRPTFFSRDDDFYQRSLCHHSYCLVSLAVGQYEVATFIRRFLRHPAFATHARRRGAVVRVSHTAIRFWRIRRDDEQKADWSH